MKTTKQFELKLIAFAELVQNNQIERLTRAGLAVPANVNNCHTHFHIGQKYARVNIGDSGRFMVEIATGNIFATLKYSGAVHKGHFYGTLDTICEYYWGEYYPVKIVGEEIPAQKANGCPVLTYAPAEDPFVADVEKAVADAVSRLDRSTVGLSEDCLWQLTCIQSSARKTPEQARAVFNEIVRKGPLAGFVYRTEK